MGREREQPPRPVLHDHARREESSSRRNRRVGRAPSRWSAGCWRTSHDPPARTASRSLRGLFGVGRAAATRLDDLDEEVRTHLDLLAADYERRGLSAADARAAARRDFGGVVQTKEAWQDERSFPRVEALGATCARARVSSNVSRRPRAPVSLSLAIAIGAATAVYSVIDTLFFRPLAVVRSRRARHRRTPAEEPALDSAESHFRAAAARTDEPGRSRGGQRRPVSPHAIRRRARGLRAGQSGDAADTSRCSASRRPSAVC